MNQKSYLLFVAFVSFSATTCCQLPGYLDPSFGYNGIATAFTAARAARPCGMAVAADGKIVWAGASELSGNGNLCVVRCLPNGTLDPDFDIDGITYVHEPDQDKNDFAFCVAMQNDQKIVVAGCSIQGNVSDFLISRILPGGNQDSTFNQIGILKIDFGSDDERANAIAIQPDQKIIVAGSGTPGFSVARINPDGSLDSTFNTAGKLIFPFNFPTALAYAVAVQTDGKIVIAGTAGPNFALLRLNPDGTPDAGFGYMGVRFINFGSNNNSAAKALKIQSDGKIVVTGNDESNQMMLVRCLPNGALDPAFGNNGIHILPEQGNANALDIQPDGSILVAGKSFDRFGLFKCNPDGSTNTGFGADGSSITEVGGLPNEAFSVIYRPDTTILVGGNYRFSSNFNMVIARFKDDLDSIPQAATTESVIKPNSLSVFPNPFEHQINIAYALQHSDFVTIRLVDGSGRTVQNLLKRAFRSKGAQLETVLIDPHLAKGEYFIDINGGEKMIGVLKQ
ncbi:MAG: T9SS type A sorting domain-containing protein [Bacteroidota bacterium]